MSLQLVIPEHFWHLVGLPRSRRPVSLMSTDYFPGSARTAVVAVALTLSSWSLSSSPFLVLTSYMMWDIVYDAFFLSCTGSQIDQLLGMRHHDVLGDMYRYTALTGPEP